MTKKEREKNYQPCACFACVPINLLSVYYKWNELNAWNETKITNKPDQTKKSQI